MRISIGLLILTVSFGVSADEKKMAFRPGAKPMRNEIRRFIKVGTPIAAAEKIMTENGFSCRLKKNDDFLATDEGSTDSKFIQRKNFLYCERTEEGYVTMSPSRRWKAALLNENEKVANVLVSFETIQPSK
ncbi:MAG: hypothetical protein KF713_08965 [Turneriella sp.]|nr:hypothetical protein [Turneriella sp.]